MKNLVEKGIFFPDCWKASFVVHICKNISKRSVDKSYCPINQNREELVVNNKLLDHMKR